MRSIVIAFLVATSLLACAAPSKTAPRASVNALDAAVAGARRPPFFLHPVNVPLPTEGFDNPPEAPFAPGDLVIRPNQMRKFYGPPGEFGYYIDGADYGLAIGDSQWRDRPDYAKRDWAVTHSCRSEDYRVTPLERISILPFVV